MFFEWLRNKKRDSFYHYFIPSSTDEDNRKSKMEHIAYDNLYVKEYKRQFVEPKPQEEEG